MSIKSQAVSDNHSMERRVDTRVMRANIDGWGVTLTRRQHLTYVNSVFESAGNVVWDVTVRRDVKGEELGYHGHLSPLQDGGYKPWSWYKINVQRRREFDVEKIRDLVNSIWAYCQSEEGQRELLRQSIETAEQEAAELASQLHLIHGWIAERNQELQAVGDAAR